MPKVSDFVALGMHLHTKEETLQLETSFVYSGDLLSIVLRSAKPKQLLVTCLANLNCIAVAVLSDIPAILFSETTTIHPSLVERANEEGIALLSSSLTSAEIIVELTKRNLL